MKVNILSNNIPWFGKYSGYECLPNYFSGLTPRIFSKETSVYNKVVGKLYQFQNKWNNTSSEEIYTGINFLKKSKECEIAHILYLETHIHLLNKTKLFDERLIGTVHLPINQWEEENLKLLSNLSNIIILYEQEIEKFNTYIPADKIHFLKHGVDIDFFRPGTREQVNKNKVLFVGHYLRNFDMMLKVYNTIVKEITDQIEFHFIIPTIWRNNIPELKKISGDKNIFFHEKLSDEELLEQYQTSNVLLMPMQDSGANTAIVQGISVGLPIITTDVGGIRSYGGSEVFPIVSNNDHLGMVELFHKYFKDDSYRDDISKSERNYAINNLDWNLVANQHISLYNSLTN